LTSYVTVLSSDGHYKIGSLYMQAKSATLLRRKKVLPAVLETSILCSAHFYCKLHFFPDD